MFGELLKATRGYIDTASGMSGIRPLSLAVFPLTSDFADTTGKFSCPPNIFSNNVRYLMPVRALKVGMAGAPVGFVGTVATVCAKRTGAAASI